MVHTGLAPAAVVVVAEDYARRTLDDLQVGCFFAVGVLRPSNISKVISGWVINMTS